MSEKKRALIAQLVFLVIGVGMFIYADTSNFRIIYKNDIGSGGVPKIVSGAIALLSVIKIVLILVDKKMSDRTSENSDLDLKKGLACVALLGAYVFSLKKIGFPIATPVYLFLTMCLLASKEKRNYKLFAIISLLFSAVVFVLFYYVLHVMIPVGLLKNLIG